MEQFITVVGAIVIPCIIFLYSNYRTNVKAREDRVDDLKEQLEKLENKIAAIPESFSRIHQRIDSLEHNHNKLETAVEVRLDKFSDKLEKIYDILVERASGG